MDTTELRDHGTLQHQISRLELRAVLKKRAQQQAGDRERRVRHDFEGPVRQQETPRVYLHDRDGGTVEPSLEDGRTTWMQLNGKHPGTSGDEVSCEGTGARANIEDEVPLTDSGCGDQASCPVVR